MQKTENLSKSQNNFQKNYIPVHNTNDNFKLKQFQMQTTVFHIHYILYFINNSNKL